MFYNFNCVLQNFKNILIFMETQKYATHFRRYKWESENRKIYIKNINGRGTG